MGEQMKYIDLHCDTILGLLEDKKHGDLFENNLCIDLQKLKEGNSLVQTFAMFTDKKAYEIPEKQTEALIDLYEENLKKYASWIRPVLKYEDILNNEKNGIMSSLLSLEEGDVIYNDLDSLDTYYEKGVRMIALTWNYPNAIGHPNFSLQDFEDYKQVNPMQQIETKHGLTPFGMDYVKKMESLGMIVDVSHLGDAGFWDVVKICNKPFIASHSNARSICHVARNLSDEMIQALHRKGGVMGINFCGDFLQEGTNQPSTIQAMVRHIQHIASVSSIDCIAIGTDFDGIHSKLEITDASYMYLLEEALLHSGFTQEEVEKIFYKNALRVFKECWL